MSDRTTHLTVTGLHDPTMRADTEVLLLPATERFYFLTATFTLSQWAENWESRQAGNPPPNVVEGRVISGDDRDEGVVDRWPMCLAAWPIQPAGDSDGTWQLTEGIAGRIGSISQCARSASAVTGSPSEEASPCRIFPNDRSRRGTLAGVIGPARLPDFSPAAGRLVCWSAKVAPGRTVVWGFAAGQVHGHQAE